MAHSIEHLATPEELSDLAVLARRFFADEEGELPDSIALEWSVAPAVVAAREILRTDHPLYRQALAAHESTPLRVLGLWRTVAGLPVDTVDWLIEYCQSVLVVWDLE
jgi:hypothetical protein